MWQELVAVVVIDWNAEKVSLVLDKAGLGTRCTHIQYIRYAIHLQHTNI